MFVFIVRPARPGPGTAAICNPAFQVFQGGDIKKIQNLAKNSDDPFHALNYYYDGKLTTSRY